MRRIKTQEQVGRSQKRNKLLVGGILIFLMLFSTAGYAFYGNSGASSGDSNSEDPSQNTFGSNFNGQYWTYTAGGQEFYFTNIIQLAQTVPIEGDIELQNYAGAVLFVNSENQDVITEIVNNLGRYLVRVQPACLGECAEDLPEISCEGEENLIIWVESEDDKVYQEGNCVFIEGNSDLVSVDTFLYRALGFI